MYNLILKIMFKNFKIYKNKKYINNYLKNNI